jgi:hypothetical protein
LALCCRAPVCWVSIIRSTCADGATDYSAVTNENALVFGASIAARRAG